MKNSFPLANRPVAIIHRLRLALVPQRYQCLSTCQHLQPHQRGRRRTPESSDSHGQTVQQRAYHQRQYLLTQPEYGRYMAGLSALPVHRQSLVHTCIFSFHLVYIFNKSKICSLYFTKLRQIPLMTPDTLYISFGFTPTKKAKVLPP